MGSSYARFCMFIIMSNLLPFNSLTKFSTKIALIHSQSFNIPSKNNELLLINLTKSMVISRLWYVTFLFHFAPNKFVGIELISICSIIIINNATKNNDTMAKNSGSVMGNIAWLVTFAFDRFPIDVIFRIVTELLNSSNIKSPHSIHRTFFDISATMNIQIIINDKTAMVGSSFRKLPLKPNITERALVVFTLHSNGGFNINNIFLSLKSYQ